MQKDSRYILSVKEEDDILGIAEYTIHNFGIEQSKKYAESLKSILIELSNNPKLGKEYWTIENKVVLRYRFKAQLFFITLPKRIYLLLGY